ncbi:unnamed protein product [Chondrus crispus]|uniref:Uncharacterized protein n=1 Tax=Chondrus crispus TaxID=2769 RepID=R7QE37_CHOCR|nr:unnamed protein product [Chondrus crispus]CDF35993.1 unnamed protein product [Chondrus crispus]|eukprot:XP_005715812.1 unnamed protein product [Chondrus crispus]
MASRGHPSPCVTAGDWAFLQSRHTLTDGAAAADARVVRNAIVASNACNVGLLAAQLFVLTASASLAILAVFIDALLDTVSGAVLAATWYWKGQRDPARYPVGRSRLEPLGVIAMACLMTAATLLALEKSVGALVEGAPSEALSGLSVGTGAVLVGAMAIKVGLYWYCAGVPDASVRALAEDHFNDLMSNAVGLCTVLVAQHVAWWVDPAGGVVISCWIIHNWVVHTLEHFDQLLGKAAGPDVINLLTFMACNHHPAVVVVDTVRGYHVGHGVYVEVDIVLPPDMPLYKAHDIAESLQRRIEMVDEVERCFVHSDTETRHSPHWEHKQV